jgi:hypothetical protein
LQGKREKSVKEGKPMQIVKMAKKGNLTLKIVVDEEPESPREWDNLGTMVCWHGRYNLGDKHDFPTPEDFTAYLKTHDAVVLPVIMYDHSGLFFSTTRNYPFDDHWDAGQVGYIYVTYEKLRKNYNVKRLTTKILDQARNSLIGEIETYTQWSCGNVYGFIVEEVFTCDKGFEHTRHVDSCWGFYGSDLEKNGIMDSVSDIWKNAEFEEITA